MGRIIDFIRGKEYTDDEENVEGYENEEFDVETENTPSTPITPSRASTGVSSSTALEMKVCRPSKFEEGPEIAKHLLNGKTVVLNLEDANRDTIIRLIDFLFGVTFAIEGNLKKVSSYTYVITPKNVEVDNEAKAAAPAKAEEGTDAAQSTGSSPRPLF